VNKKLVLFVALLLLAAARVFPVSGPVNNSASIRIGLAPVLVSDGDPKPPPIPGPHLGVLVADGDPRPVPLRGVLVADGDPRPVPIHGVLVADGDPRPVPLRGLLNVSAQPHKDKISRALLQHSDSWKGEDSSSSPFSSGGACIDRATPASPISCPARPLNLPPARHGFTSRPELS
jgi:hypothetical protein